MKKLLIFLFSLYFLNSPSVFADDISDFEIEGMSIGDSLLDYMTADEINEKIELSLSFNEYYYLNEPNKYVEVYSMEALGKYDNGFSFFIRNTPTNQYLTNKNEEYTILSIYGMMNFIENFQGCIKKRNKIVKELSEMFPNIQKTENIFEHSADPSGNSIVDAVYFEFDSGDYVEVSCDNFDETIRIKNNWSEGLNLAISSKEITSWLVGY
jgi:hypothetical protein